MRPPAPGQVTEGATSAPAKETAMKWVTRKKARVDRIACPWLIQRFVDPAAEFLFVPDDLVTETARREGAIPFDVPDVELGHHGDRCSFDAFIKKYQQARPTAMGYLRHPAKHVSEAERASGCSRHLSAARRA